MKKITFLIPVIGFFLFSCSNTSNENSKDQTETVTHEEHHQNNENQNIRLNDGEKWLVNDEMKPHIREAQNILKEYEESNSENYRELSAKLKEANSGLISSCTMNGESHDQLHKWLHPHMQLVDKLEKAGDHEEANKFILRLKKSFKTYKQYFQ
jgi:hypothetical protein